MALAAKSSQGLFVSGERMAKRKGKSAKLSSQMNTPLKVKTKGLSKY